MMGLIHLAAETAARRFGWFVLSERRDEGGVYAVLMSDREKSGRFFVVARERLWISRENGGAWLSANRWLVDDAAAAGVPIVVFVRDSGAFYRFDPEEVIADPRTYKNVYHGQRMYNFDVRHGRNWEKVEGVEVE